jgi:hypothetical protein
MEEELRRKVSSLVVPRLEKMFGYTQKNQADLFERVKNASTEGLPPLIISEITVLSNLTKNKFRLRYLELFLNNMKIEPEFIQQYSQYTKYELKQKLDEKREQIKQMSLQ